MCVEGKRNGNKDWEPHEEVRWHHGSGRTQLGGQGQILLDTVQHEFVSTVRMSPLVFKRMAIWMSEHVKRYESMHGEIQVGKAKPKDESETPSYYGWKNSYNFSFWRKKRLSVFIIPVLRRWWVERLDAARLLLIGIGIDSTKTNPSWLTISNNRFSSFEFLNPVQKQRYAFVFNTR